MMSINLIVAGLAAIAATLPLPTNGDGFALGAPKTSIQHAGDVLGHGRMFVEKTAVEVRDHLVEPLKTEGAGQAIRPRFVYIVSHNGYLPPIVIFGIVCASIVAAGSLVGFILYCYSDRAFSRKPATMDDVHEAARVGAEALKPGAFVNNKVDNNELVERAVAILASPEAQNGAGEKDILPPPANCHVKPEN